MLIEAASILRLKPRNAPSTYNHYLMEHRPLAAYGRPIEVLSLIRKLKSGEYRLYSRKKDPGTGRRRNLGTFATRKAAEAHERAVQFFKRR